MGRLRCLVQGCCHGHSITAEWGICYRHPRSRVLRLADLGEVPLHPTQLYSLVWNLLCLFALWRLWSLHVPVTWVGGTYLMLNGVGRFVEEGYRGEPQTIRMGGLAIYQWLALLSLLVGAGVTTLTAPPTPPIAGFDLSLLLLSPAVGSLVTTAMGLDFPESRRRFSRLV